MAIYKLTFYFLDNDGASWTDVFYTSQASSGLAVGAGIGVMPARLALLCTSATLLKITARNTSGTRDTATFVANLPGTQAVVAPGPAPASTAAVIQLYGILKNQRKWWLRGFLGNFVQRSLLDGSSVFPAAFGINVNTFLVAAAANGLGIRYTQQPIIKYPILSVAYNSITGYATVTFNVPPPLVAPGWMNGSRVVIAQADRKTLPGLNGHWSVTSGLGASIDIPYVVPENGTVNVNTGYVRPENYVSSIDLFSPSNCRPAYWGEHTTKNESSNSRGAARARRIRRLA